MVKYIVGFVALFVLILYFSFVGLGKKTPSVTTTEKPKAQQRETTRNTEIPKNKEVRTKVSEPKPESKPASLPSAKKAMVGGAEVEWVEPTTPLGEGEFGRPPE